MTNGFFMLSMLVYTLASGIWIGQGIEHFKKSHYYRFGIAVTLAISSILLMAETIFCY